MSQSQRPDKRRHFIKSVRFHVLSADEIKRFSVCSITESSLYTASLPTNGSVVDFRMGSVDRRLKCGTCRRSVTSCPGHFGSIMLNFPVLHPGYLDTILKLLRCVCFFCSSLLIPEKDRACLSATRERKQRLSLAVSLCKTKKLCSNPCCESPQPTYQRVGLTIRCDWSKVRFSDPDEARYCQRPFTSTEVNDILRHISDDVAELLGFSKGSTRPEQFVLTHLCVPPPIIRPSITMSEHSRARGQDDLTMKLCDIVKANTVVKNVLEREALAIPQVGLSVAAQQAVTDLAFHVSTFMNNELRGQRPSMQRSGLPSKSLTSRLKGKEGRIRGSLMGKRVNFSARSVVSPDSQMAIDQVGVPEIVARKLTVPEKVTDWTLSRLRACVRAGPHSLHGAQSIIHPDGQTILLEFADTEKELKQLQVGDIVERFLQNDDIVLFNRQPSLHKGSMMSYKVVLMPDRTFRLNMAVTLPLNADCDGDELNVHVPQDEESQTEARLLMAVPTQIVSPQANKPCIGFVQDAVIGSWLLTQPETVLSKTLARELCASILNEDVLARPQLHHLPDEVSGRFIYSQLLPANLQYVNKKVNVVIRDGQLIEGVLCKVTLGATSGGLVHSMYMSHGPERTAQFLSDAQRLVNRYLMSRGFSIRLSDCEPARETMEHVLQTIRLAEQKMRQIQQHAGVMAMLPQQAEAALSEIANRVLTHVGKVVHASLSSKSNSLYQAVLCASKGNLINIAQLLGCIGQQSVDGRRVTPDDTQGVFGAPGSMESTGFVSHSYFQGLQSREFFFHTMAGREGLIDTAVKTANTGYLQRRLMKAMETLTIAFDYTVRNARETIIQFSYGADDFDATFLQRVAVNWILDTDAALFLQFGSLDDAEWQNFRRILHYVRRLRLRDICEMELNIFLPCNIPEILLLMGKPGRATRAEAHELLEDIIQSYCKTRWGWRSQFELYLRYHLRSMVAMRLSSESLRDVYHELRRRVEMAIISPGEAVGALSAQSISEPLTQLTLNTFHMAGVKSKNVTLGVPRIKELIDLTRNMKTPAMRVVLKPHISLQQAEHFQARIIHMTLEKVLAELEFLYEPNPYHTDRGPLDAKVLHRDWYVTPPSQRQEEVPCPWIGRIVLQAAMLLPIGLLPCDVASAIMAHMPVHVLASLEVDEEWILRIRPLRPIARTSQTPAEEKLAQRTYTETQVIRACRETVLGGLPGVSSCSASVEQIMYANADGQLVKEDRVVVETCGGSLSHVMRLPEVDALRCTSNDVHNVHATLGIEAAQAVLFEQIKSTLQFDGSYTNERHLSLLCNFCTAQSALLPISRHGINRCADTGALSRASFEEVTDQLLEAACYGDEEETAAFSPAIMVGQRSLNVGTGICYTQALTRSSPKEDSSDEEVVFTAVDADIQMLTTYSDVHSTETPWTDGAGAQLPVALQNSFLPASAAVRSFTPASPKLMLNAKPSSFVPTSPRRYTFKSE